MLVLAIRLGHCTTATIPNQAATDLLNVGAEPGTSTPKRDIKLVDTNYRALSGIRKYKPRSSSLSNLPNPISHPSHSPLANSSDSLSNLTAIEARRIDFEDHSSSEEEEGDMSGPGQPPLGNGSADKGQDPAGPPGPHGLNSAVEGTGQQLFDNSFLQSLMTSVSAATSFANADMVKQTIVWPQLRDAMARIPKYSKDNSFSEFLKIAEATLVRNDAPENMKMKALLEAMDAEAIAHLSRQPENTSKTCGPFTDGVEYLKTVFPEKNSEEKKRILKERTQKSGESYQEYVNRKIEEAHRIGIELNKKFYKSVAHGFTNYKLKENMLELIEQPTFQSEHFLEWIFVYTKKEERFKNSHRAQTSFRHGSPHSKDDSVDHSRNRSSSRDRDRSPSRSQDRKSRSDGGRDERSSRPRSSTPKRDILCYECGQEGHVRSNCPARTMNLMQDLNTFMSMQAQMAQGPQQFGPHPGQSYASAVRSIAPSAQNFASQPPSTHWNKLTNSMPAEQMQFAAPTGHPAEWNKWVQQRSASVQAPTTTLIGQPSDPLENYFRRLYMGQPPVGNYQTQQ